MGAHGPACCRSIRSGGRRGRIDIRKPDAGPGPGLREGLALQPHGAGCGEQGSPSVQHSSVPEPVGAQDAQLPVCTQATGGSVASAVDYTVKPIEQLINTIQTVLSPRLDQR